MKESTLKFLRECSRAAHYEMENPTPEYLEQARRRAEERTRFAIDYAIGMLQGQADAANKLRFRRYR